MAIVHLIDSETVHTAQPTLAMFADVLKTAPGMDDRVWLVGTPDDQRSLERLGLPVARRFRPSLRGFTTGSIMAESLVHAIGSAWTLPGVGRYQPCLVTPSSVEDVLRRRSPAEWSAGRFDALWLAIHPAIRDELIGNGVARSRVISVEPGIDLRRMDRTLRRQTRQLLGLDCDQILLVAVLADPPSRTDALLTMLGVGLARESGRPVRALISSDARGLDRARKVLRDTRREGTMILDRAVNRPWEVLAACDSALVIGEGLCAGWAMCAGLPIVAVDSPAVRHQLTDGVTAWLSPSCAPGQLARLICRIVDEPDRASALGAAAAAEALRRYDATRFATEWRRAWSRH